MQFRIRKEKKKKTVTGPSLKAFNLPNKTYTHGSFFLHLPALKCSTNMSCVCARSRGASLRLQTQGPWAAGRQTARRFYVLSVNPRLSAGLGLEYLLAN